MVRNIAILENPGEPSLPRSIQHVPTVTGTRSMEIFEGRQTCQHHLDQAAHKETIWKIE